MLLLISNNLKYKKRELAELQPEAETLPVATLDFTCSKPLLKTPPPNDRATSLRSLRPLRFKILRQEGGDGEMGRWGDGEMGRIFASSLFLLPSSFFLP
jgi:hypothetical protein